MKKQTTIPGGHFYYKKAGLTKSVILHLTPELHLRLNDLAKKEERSVQVTLRRIIEEHLKLKR